MISWLKMCFPTDTDMVEHNPIEKKSKIKKKNFQFFWGHGGPGWGGRVVNFGG